MDGVIEHVQVGAGPNFARWLLTSSRLRGVTDDPRERRGGIANQVYLSLANLIAEAETELLMVSAYFVPSVDQITGPRALTDRHFFVRD